MQEILQQQRADGFPALAGAQVRGRIPVREAVLNEAAQTVLRESGANLPAQLRGLRILADNRIAIDLSVNLMLFRAPVTLTARIEPAVEVARGGLLVVHLEGLAGTLSPLLRAVAGVLPPGVLLIDQKIVVKPQEMLAAQKMGDLARLVRRVEFATQPGCLFVAFDLRVD